jgi:hypothetical protein
MQMQWEMGENRQAKGTARGPKAASGPGGSRLHRYPPSLSKDRELRDPLSQRPCPGPGPGRSGRACRSRSAAAAAARRPRPRRGRPPACNPQGWPRIIKLARQFDG